MLVLVRSLLLLAVVFVGACAGPGPKSGPGPSTDPVILISIDGFRADHLDRGLTPTLASFAHTHIVIVSDHGMTASSSDRLIYLDDVVNAADANVVTYGILSGINPKSGHTDAVEHALLATHDHMSC